MCRLLQRSQKEPCGHEQQQRDRDLATDEDLSEPGPSPIGARVDAPQRWRDVDARALQRGQQRECDRGKCGQRDRHEMDPRIDAYIERKRHRQ